jgi:2-iminobutanoate/2-iminopropanoate deaminase
MTEVVFTENAPKPIGPFSQAIRANGFVFVSGHVAMDPATQKLIDGDVAAQTERTLQNISTVLEAAGSSLRSVVRTGVYLTNMADFAQMNEVYARWFSANRPARTTIEVSKLPLAAAVEIDVVALVEK